MKVCWITDIHLNFLVQPARLQFYESIRNSSCEAVLITGDIAEAMSVTLYLQEMADDLQRPIYFVMGNHDYYGGQILDVRRQITDLCQAHKYLSWVTTPGGIKLTDDVVITGIDGWADGRYGDYHNSEIVLNDSRLIYDISSAAVLGKDKLLKKMQELADADAADLAANLEKISQQAFKKVIILTHVPPFAEVCIYKDKATTADWLPFFSSKATGDVILKIAEQNQDKEYLVLSGHTHSAHTYLPDT